MAIGRDIIGSLAKQFGYSKELVREALASNQIDPLTASLIGSRIDKMQQTKQEAGSRTTVLEDVLAPKPEEVMGRGIAAAPQQAPSALAALPSNLPAEGMAGGGIVAFAEGGDLDLDDDEDEVKEKSTMSQLIGKLSGGLEGLRSMIPQDVNIPMPKSYEAALAEKGQTPATVRKAMRETPTTVETITSTNMPKRGGHKYEDAVIREAERIGLDPNLAVHALYKETGGIKNPEAVRSKAGAIGIMQLMPGTAKELGVDPFDPEQNIRGGVAYLKKMMDKYNDPALALAAYNAGPGRVDRALKSGKGIESLSRETQNYVVANRMAGGGIVAFQNTGLVSGEFSGIGGTGEDQEDYVTVDPYFVTDPMSNKPMPSGYRKSVPKSEARPEAIIKKTPPKPDTSPLPAMGPTDEELGRYAGVVPPAPGIIGGTGGKPGEEKEDSVMKKFMSLLEGREKSAADQRKQDAYLSLLSAGLGMMGGTSPYAAVNIGQGAQAGIAAQAAARKTQAAEQAATLKGFGTAAAAEEYAKQRQLLAAQAQEAKIPQQLASMKQNVMKNIIAARKLDINSLDQNQLAEIERLTESALAKDAGYQALYGKLYGGQFVPTPTAAPKVDVFSTYGLKKQS